MKRFIFITVIVLLLSAMASGCNQQKESTPVDILNNNVAFIDQSGNSIYLKDYRSKNFSETPVITKYALVDLNDNGSQELVAYNSQNYGFYIIFYKYKENFYSFELTEREFIDLKDDGTFMQSESTFINKYVKLSFENNSPIIVEKAYKNDIDNIYRINNAEVSYDTLKNYENSFRNKSSAVWIYLESKNLNNKDYSIYRQFLNDIKNDTPDGLYYIEDIDGDSVKELLLLKNTELSIYTIDETVTLIDSHDFITGTVRFFSSDNSDYPGIFYFTAGGSCEHYGYLTVKDKKLSFENLWEKNHATDTSEINELSENKALISESQKLYNNDCDLPFILVD